MDQGHGVGGGGRGMLINSMDDCVRGRDIGTSPPARHKKGGVRRLPPEPAPRVPLSSHFFLFDFERRERHGSKKLDPHAHHGPVGQHSRRGRPGCRPIPRTVPSRKLYRGQAVYRFHRERACHRRQSRGLAAGGKRRRGELHFFHLGPPGSSASPPLGQPFASNEGDRLTFPAPRTTLANAMQR